MAHLPKFCKLCTSLASLATFLSVTLFLPAVLLSLFPVPVLPVFLAGCVGQRPLLISASGTLTVKYNVDCN